MGTLRSVRVQFWCGLDIEDLKPSRCFEIRDICMRGRQCGGGNAGAGKEKCRVRLPEELVLLRWDGAQHNPHPNLKRGRGSRLFMPG